MTDQKDPSDSHPITLGNFHTTSALHVILANQVAIMRGLSLLISPGNVADTLARRSIEVEKWRDEIWPTL